MNPQSEPKQPCGNFGFAPFLKEFRFPLMGFRTFGRGIYECTWQETQGKGWQETQKKILIDRVFLLSDVDATKETC